jgi:hypothetical protein
MGFVAQTPARIIVITPGAVPIAEGVRDWSAVRQALRRFADMRFIVFAEDATALAPGALNLVAVGAKACATKATSPVEVILTPLCALLKPSP